MRMLEATNLSRGKAYRKSNLAGCSQCCLKIDRRATSTHNHKHIRATVIMMTFWQKKAQEPSNSIREDAAEPSFVEVKEKHLAHQVPTRKQRLPQRVSNQVKRQTEQVGVEVAVA